MNRNGGDDFSNVILAIAVVLYLAITAASFGGVVASNPTAGAAALNWMKDYGAIIAGIPVFVAVLVAKQQLDASRRQHYTNTKLSFHHTIEVLEEIKAYFDILEAFSKKESRENVDQYLRRSVDRFVENDRMLDRWEKHISPFLSELIRQANASFRKSEDMFRSDGPSENNDRLFQHANVGAKMIVEYVEKRQRELEQYWS